MGSGVRIRFGRWMVMKREEQDAHSWTVRKRVSLSYRYLFRGLTLSILDGILISPTEALEDLTLTTSTTGLVTST